MTDPRWVEQQMAHTILQWDQTMSQRYPESRAWSESPETYVQHLTVECNYLNAVKQIDVSGYMPSGSTVLDLGCGGGWLTAYLSSLPAINRVYALDSSQRYVKVLLPRVVEIMHGTPDKVVPIEGLFSPLLLEDGALDAVAAASVMHHADNLEAMLREVRRVLKKGGFLFILNESPAASMRHLLSVMKEAARIFLALATEKYDPNPRSISSSAYLDEPYLGDRRYPLWYWRQAIERSGFHIKRIVDTGLPTLVNSDGRPHLTHFVCEAV